MSLIARFGMGIGLVARVAAAGCAADPAEDASATEAAQTGVGPDGPERCVVLASLGLHIRERWPAGALATIA